MWKVHIDRTLPSIQRDLLQTQDRELHLFPEWTDLIITGRSVIAKSLEKELKIPEILKIISTKRWSKISIYVELIAWA